MSYSTQPMANFIGFLFIFLAAFAAADHDVLKNVGNILSNVDIECNTNSIVVSVETSSKHDFNGLIYPKGLSSNSTCLHEYEHAGSKVFYKLPLRSCNTMSHEIKEGLEFYNTIVIQPHSKLVTSQGKGFTVRCRYQTNKTGSENAPSAPLPNCNMKIFLGDSVKHKIAENVKIGDYLTLKIDLEDQNHYGMKVTNCIVRDGLTTAEQPLINNEGCPIDEEVLGSFEYNKALTSASVTFPAHKFPSTNSVYYQCYVKLCNKMNGGCDDLPPVCDHLGNNVRRRRRKRQSDNELEDQGNLKDLQKSDGDLRSRSIEVFSGLYVNEAGELEDEFDNAVSLSSPKSDDEFFCVSTRKFGIGIAIAGILLTLAVILLVACIVHRRRRRKGSSTAGSSIYSGPYSNQAYSRD